MWASGVSLPARRSTTARSAVQVPIRVSVTPVVAGARGDAADLAAPDREQELVVVAAGDGFLHRIAAARFEDAASAGVNRQRARVHDDAHAACLGQAVDAVGEAIARDRCTRWPRGCGRARRQGERAARAQVCPTSRLRRLGSVVRVTESVWSLTYPLAATTRLSRHQLSRSHRVIAGPRAAACQHLPALDGAGDGDVDHQRSGRARQVASGQVQAMPFGEPAEAGRRSRRNPRAAGQAAAPSASSASRGAAPIAARSLRLTASARWPIASGGTNAPIEVDALHDAVYGQHFEPVPFGLDDGGVVANPDGHPGRCGRQLGLDPRDQLAFAQL